MVGSIPNELLASILHVPSYSIFVFTWNLVEHNWWIRGKTKIDRKRIRRKKHWIERRGRRRQRKRNWKCCWRWWK
jgi:hypothetical protein